MKESAWLDIVRMQKTLYKRNQRFIEESVQVKEPEFDKYKKDYEKATKRYQRISNYDEMLSDVFKSNIVMVGDYHTCGQSQRSFLRLLKSVVKKNRKFSVCMELLNVKDQPELDKFLNRKTGEKTFLKRIKLEEHWVFDLWPNFKPIFDFCRYHHIPMYAIESAKKCLTVWQRDKIAGELIADIYSKDPRKTFVVIGDLHLAPNHLPKYIEESLIKKNFKCERILNLYENCDEIYWDLAENDLAMEVEVVKVDENSYCRLHTPPVLCQQSYINWLEHEEGEFDFVDARQSFLDLVERLSKFLSIDVKSKYENVEVYTSGDLSFLSNLQEDKNFTPDEIETIKQQILCNESYYIAKAGIVYLGSLSLNHASEEASHFIKHMCAGNEKSRNIIDAFYANVLHEMLGFFGSKVINHKRKCDHWDEIESLVDYFSKNEVPSSRKAEVEAANVAVEVKRREVKDKPILIDMIDSRPDLFFILSHFLGYMLGDHLYYGLLKNVISRKEIKQIYYDRWEGVGTPFAVYRRLSKRLKRVRLPKRI